MICCCWTTSHAMNKHKTNTPTDANGVMFICFMDQMDQVGGRTISKWYCFGDDEKAAWSRKVYLIRSEIETNTHTNAYFSSLLWLTHSCINAEYLYGILMS